ncbi:MAG: hypothetical protein Kow0010_19480 [Dehalococcoidia bacterium]
MSTVATRQTNRRAGSWLLSVSLVAFAGAIAWHATGASAVDHPDPATTETLAATIEPALEPPAVEARAGALPTRLVVPSVGIDVPIREVGAFRTGSGALTWETAWDAAGHHLDSARPGQPGNVIISGHVSVANPSDVAVFASLGGVAEGDVIEVHAGEMVFRYIITEIRVVRPDDVEVLRSDHRARITLVTCTSDLEGRLIVRGELA